MKKAIAAAAVLLASTVVASAADMPVKARPMVAPIEVWGVGTDSTSVPMSAPDGAPLSPP